MASQLHRLKTLLQLTELGLLGVLLIALPEPVSAQNRGSAASSPAIIAVTNSSAVTDKKPVPGPFHGKLLAVDRVAKTISVGKRTFQITAETKIKKGGRSATLQDGVIGEPVSGYVKPTPDGKWLAASVNFGPKVPETGATTKKSKSSIAK